MTFVFEKIDEQQLQEFFKVIPRTRMLAPPHSRFIDRKRDLVFVCFGGRGDEPKERGFPSTEYALVWKGMPVRFNGYLKRDYLTDMMNVEIDIAGLWVPNALQNELDEVVEVLNEALTCYYDHQEISRQFKPQHASVVVRLPEPKFY